MWIAHVWRNPALTCCHVDAPAWTARASAADAGFGPEAATNNNDTTNNPRTRQRPATTPPVRPRVMGPSLQRCPPVHQRPRSRSVNATAGPRPDPAPRPNAAQGGFGPRSGCCGAANPGASR